MRRALPAMVVVLASVHPLAAQTPDLRGAGLPREEASRLQAVMESENTRRYEGDAAIRASEVIDGPVLVHRGILTMAGTIRGELIVVDGDVVFRSGARVTGNVTVVGGTIVDAAQATLAGTVTEYGEGFGVLAQAHRLHDGRDDWRDGRRRGWRGDQYYGGQDADIAFRVAANYNRVEGLPVEIGPDIRSGGANPIHIEALAVWRTDQGPLTNTQRMGYVGRLEQSLGRALRVGGTVRSTVDPIESWGVTDLEASLAAAMLHTDQRDYFEREGWSAFVRVHPRRSPFDFVIEYRDERHAGVAARDPWTLFNRSDPWRDQPLVGEGRLRLVDGSVSWDTRRGGDFVATGWYAHAQLLRGVDGTLDLTVPSDGASATAEYDATGLSAGFLDLRRYAPIGWDASLGLRFVAGGSLNDEALAPQFQHALGGAGTLPGYPLLSLDCGARRFTVADGDVRYFPSYGCDRFALAQVEYRGGIDLHFGHGYHDFDADVDWTVFFDAARGWAVGDGAGRANSGIRYDAGAGIILGGFGIYGAVPLTGDDSGLRMFVRLDPRF